MTMIRKKSDSYNPYTELPDFSYKCISLLMDKNELIWKLLKYPTPNAWNMGDLTHAEKASLIWAGEGDSTDFHVFMDDGLPDVETREDTILRITPYQLFPDNRTVGTVIILMEVYAHYKVNSLSNYKTRIDTIIQQLLEVFNGEEISGIGRLHFDKVGTGATRMEMGGQIPFKGKWLLLGNKVA
jgi:hypothetical protein